MRTRPIAASGSIAHQRPGPGDQMLAGPPALLDVTGCETTDELDALLSGAFDLDPFVLECTSAHVLVVIADRGVALCFPFTIDDFWVTVAGLETEAAQRIEDASDVDR